MIMIVHKKEQNDIQKMVRDWISITQSSHTLLCFTIIVIVDNIILLLFTAPSSMFLPRYIPSIIYLQTSRTI